MMLRGWLKLSLLLVLGATDARAATFAEGMDAYRQNRVADARRAYEAVLVDANASAADKAGAARELARIAWLVDGQTRPALARLERAETLGAGLCDTGILAARMLREAQRRAEAIARGRALIERCDDPAKKDLIRLQMIDASLELAVAERARRTEHLDAARADLRQLGIDAAAGLGGARARMELGLLAGDADEALRGWREYFWLTEQNAPQALSSYDVPALFRAALAAGADDQARLAVAELLVRAGFVRPVRHFVAVAGLPGEVANDPVWRRVSAYLEQRRRFDALMLELHRGMARRGADDAAFLDQIQARLEREFTAVQNALIAAAGEAAGRTASLSAEQRGLALLRHYGIFGTDPGRTGGHPGLHLGHVTGDRGQQSALFGHRVDVRFVELDNMITNGFHSWLWDGNGASGGWAAGSTIVGTREGYTAGPVRAYALLNDGPGRREILANQSRLAQEDLERLRAAPVAYLRGLDDRLRLQAFDRIAAVARARMAPGGDFRRAFLDEYYRAAWYNSFDLHEARHIVDFAVGAGAGDADDAARSAGFEYRAKLTEVQLADYPRLALSGLLDGNVGDASGHGQGNYRVLDLFRRWIEAHPGEVLGYDPAVPALAQLDKLTDEQMRAVAREADPLAVPPQQ